MWWCIMMSQSHVKTLGWYYQGIVKVTLRAYVIKIGLFLLYFLYL